ncbi:aminoacyl tRNA synthase complex-interacting multifunctional protein 2-like isoform X2 [Ischnura elegans]|uniref:aminoacyl tRNA synthase complex-interacting multifunctional protein 2-like isoform X2 n=1 Tax=Ischnura elegans TaxID=197161 RepID=UPI001ED894EC|nr:aminoacyl tRNA synthase complex-interacting multifunctional protein 2-like isoform X2 [Ischnura elegans]
MKEVPCMYRLKPICGLPVRVELPKCMYRLRQIQGSYDATDVRRDNIMAKSHEIEEQENLPAVTKLEQRQEIILAQLRNLKCLVEELSRQLRLPPTSSVQTSGVLCMKESAPKEVLQLVVKASPARIPHALLALIQSSCSGVEDASKVKPRCVEVNWHSHSTLCKPLPSLPSSNEQSCAPSIRITFIWKDAVKQVEFSIGNSPVWLKGEPLLMRVILSHLSSTPVKDNVVTDVALAALLDSCAAISDISSESSSSSIKQTFSEANKWFSCLDLIPSNSHSMSVGEMSLWGALKSVSSIGNDGCLPQETPAKLKDWFTSYSKFLGY